MENYLNISCRKCSKLPFQLRFKKICSPFAILTNVTMPSSPANLFDHPLVPVTLRHEDIKGNVSNSSCFPLLRWQGNTWIYNSVQISLNSVPQITRFLLTKARISSKTNTCSGSIR